MTQPAQLNAQDLLARAQQETGIDILDDDITEPLEAMVKSLNEESHLHEAGMKAMDQRLLRLLCNRLRMLRDFQDHPEIDDQQILPPVVICGMARTGSTKMQKLLASTGDFNWLPYWQSMFPSLISGDPAESPQARIDAAEKYCRWFDEMSPEAKYGHAQETFEPDEESYMLEHCFETACFLGWSDLPGYLAWLSNTDMTKQFHFLKQCLKYLQWQGLHNVQKPWVLKCPLYFGLEPALLSVFPDARLIMTHRHPVEIIASACRLLETFHKPFTNQPIDYQAFLAGTSGQIAMHLAVREKDEIDFLDLPFHMIVKNPDIACEKVYRHCGMAFTESARHNAIAWHESHPQNKKGLHSYSLEDFNFNTSMIEDAFADYIALGKFNYSGD